MDFRRHPILYVVSLSLLCITPGCSTLYRSTNSQVAVNPVNGDNVRILQDAWNWDEGFHFQDRGKGITWVNMDNNQSVHLIRLEQPHHFSEVHPVFPQRQNPYKFADIGGAAGLAIAGVVGNNRDLNQNIVIGAFVGSAINALAWFMKPTKAYDRSFYFEPLRPIPEGNPQNPPLKIEGFHMRIPQGKHSWHYFENMDKYALERVEFINSSEEAIEIEYSNLDESLNEMLQNQGFQPVPSEGMFHRGEAVQLTGQLTEVREHRVQNIVRYELETEWWIYNAFGLNTDTASVTTSSNWALYNFSNPGFDRALIIEALDQALFQAIESESISDKLNRIEDLESEWTRNWDVIALEQPSAPAGKIAEALESIVTIAADDGHGSGCIIGSNGYIVTNYHVIADGALDYQVHFKDGSQLPAEIVRYHPVYDLALLKVDTTGLRPFQIRRTESIDIGDEAFALGTPYDIDLGASVTKGIVSGRRKDGNRSLIQTDVSISPGNSGGALITVQGELIGIVNEKVLGVGVEGIGFAIPAEAIESALFIDFQ